MGPTPSPDTAVEDSSKRRQMPSHGGEHPANTSKKRKTTGEEEIRRVAEIILVLSAMGRMRGGRDPTMAEKSMMTEAKNKIVSLCEDLSPKDILPYDDDSFRVLIDDLGLSRLKEQFLGHRTPKLSISERFHHAKRRMEEKSYANQPTSFPSQCLQNGGAAGDRRRMPSNVRMFSSDKAGQSPVSAGGLQPQLPVSTGGSQAPIPVVQASAAPSMPLTSMPPGTEVRPPLVSGQVPHNKEMDTPAAVPARADRSHIRPDGKPNGPSMQHTPASPGTNQHMMRNTLQPMQAQPTQWTNSGTKNNVRNHPVRTDGTAVLNAPQKTGLASPGQTVKPAVVQNNPVSIPAVHHPVQGMQAVHGSSPHNRHLEISKLVQRLLDAKVSERPGWPTSRDYMNRAVNCPFCKVSINGVEGVLVCDACEKGYHLGCLQSYNAKGIPRGEWHCPRCLTMNRGKPFPPKYGRVTRNMNAPKAPSNASEVQSFLEKKVETVGGKMNQPSSVTKVETVGGKVNQPSPVTKVETADEKVNHPSPKMKVEMVYEKVNQPSPVTNGNPGFQAHVPTGKAVESSSETNLHINEIKENNVSKVKKDDDSSLEKHPIHVGGIAGEAFKPTLTGRSIDKPPQQDVKVVANAPGNELISQTDTSDALPTSNNQNAVDRESLSNGVEIPVHQPGNCNGIAEDDRNYKDKILKKCVMPENLSMGERFNSQFKGVESLENGLCSVDWIGDADRVMEDKKFFQSCCINGVVYKVQDYVLHRSGDGKVVPVKLLALWEDNKTNSKWLLVHKCYFPNDLPEEVGRPGAPLNNEVYESTHHSNVMAGFIQGPCEVLPFRKFGEESSQNSDANDHSRPVFIRNWFYDELKRAFCPSAS